MNLKNIESFISENRGSQASVHGIQINEAIGDGANLDGKMLSDVLVSEWMWDFGLQRKSFPTSSVFHQLLNPEEDLSVFTAQMVNTFAIQAWKGIKTKKIFDAAISSKEREKIRTKLRGSWASRKNLDVYMQEKEQLKTFINEFESFLVDGSLGASIQMDSESIVLSKAGDPTAGAMTKIFAGLKAFFAKSTWQKALAWIINNIANNEQHVRWLDSTVYERNRLSSGINPDVKSAFDSFIIEAGLEADMPDMEAVMPSIKYAAGLVIEKSRALPEQGRETWMGALYNTQLFGLYQKMLIIGCCAWVYDLIGDTNMLSSRTSIPSPAQRDAGPMDGESTIEGLEKDIYNDIEVYKISYLSPEFKSIITALLEDGQIGRSKFDDYVNRIDARKDSRSIIRSVRADVLGWGNTHGFKRTERPDVKGLYTDGSTRIIIPISMFKNLVG